MLPISLTNPEFLLVGLVLIAITLGLSWAARHHLARGRRRLSLALRALILTSEDRLPEASEAFALVPPAWRDATFYADWALVSQTLAQKVDPEARKPHLDDALERLTKALDLLAPGTQAASLTRRSLWLTRKGELEISLVPLQIPARRGALKAAATEDFRQAVLLDSSNLRASFLLRQATVKQETP